MMDRVVSSPFNYNYPNSVLELATRVLTLTPFIKQFVDEKEPVRQANCSSRGSVGGILGVSVCMFPSGTHTGGSGLWSIGGLFFIMSC